LSSGVTTTAALEPDVVSVGSKKIFLFDVKFFSWKWGVCNHEHHCREIWIDLLVLFFREALFNSRVPRKGQAPVQRA